MLFPGAVELPSYLVGCFAMDRIGRKNTCAPALLLAGVACMLIIVVPTVRTECVCVLLPHKYYNKDPFLNFKHVTVSALTLIDRSLRKRTDRDIMKHCRNFITII